MPINWIFGTEYYRQRKTWGFQEVVPLHAVSEARGGNRHNSNHIAYSTGPHRGVTGLNSQLRELPAYKVRSRKETSSPGGP